MLEEIQASRGKLDHEPDEPRPSTAELAGLGEVWDGQLRLFEMARQVDRLTVGLPPAQRDAAPDPVMALTAWQSIVARHLEGAGAVPSPVSGIQLRSVDTDVGRLLFPAWDRVILPALEVDGTWEPEEGAWLTSRLRPGMSVLDVGANVGYHAILTAKAVGITGRVVALEPDPLNYDLLRMNLQRNDIHNVAPIPAAAGPKSGLAELTRSLDNVGDHRLLRRQDVTEEQVISVPVVSIDQLLPASAVIDVAVIDTQGFDHHVIMGMAELIRRCQPVMLVEFWVEGIVERGDDPAAVIEQYRSLGYRVSVLDLPDLPADAAPDTIVEAADANRGHYVSLVLEPVQPAIKRR